MKIVFTVDSMNAGGAERVVATISNELRKLGHSISIIMVSYSKNECFYELDKDIKLVPLLEGYQSKPRFFKRVKVLKNALKEIRPEIVISFLPRIIAYTYFAVKGLKIPLVVSERNDPSKYPFILKVLQKHIFKKADFCVFQTDEVSNWYGLKAKKHSAVVLNPVNLTYKVSDKPIQRKKNILNVGRLEKQKNQILLLNAFKLFSEKYPDYLLKIYGNGSLKEELIDLCRTYQIEDKVTIVEADPKWQEKEYDSSVFVLSSDYEGMPNCLMEALALGIPCVSTDCPVGGPRALIEDGVNGYLVPVNDVEKMASAIEKAINNPIYDARLLKEASHDFIGKRWESLLESVLND